jgi:hypothetical protein
VSQFDKQSQTRDTLPFVGPLPGDDDDGLFVSIGFHGHGEIRSKFTNTNLCSMPHVLGMCRALIAARGLVSQMLTPSLEWDVRLPRAFEITTERLEP